MAKPPDDSFRDSGRDLGAPRRDDANAPRRDWYGGRTGSRVSVEIPPGTGRRDGGGFGGPRGFGDDRPPRTGPSRFGADRPPRDQGYGGGGGRRENHPPIDWDKWEADLEAALKARNGEA